MNDAAAVSADPAGTRRSVDAGHPITSVDPEPSHEEAAAIVAAVELAWPRPGGSAEPEPLPRWRFSGRWWTKPVPVRRPRP